MSGQRRTSIRKPVRRNGADRYILLSLVSFAISVSVTRLFLQLTGYPQIGSGELHIAHVLWGGLILFIAALLPLLFANRWVYTTSAILSGMGVGLFIDEVGKFITKNNNYFYPAAAPIIYAFFLIIVLLYTQIRRRRSEDPRTEMYTIIDELEEVLDNDLSDDEKLDIKERLHIISQQKSDKNISLLGESIEEFIDSNKIELVPHIPDLWENIQIKIEYLAERLISQDRLRYFLICGMAILGVWTLSEPSIVIVDTKSVSKLQAFLANLISASNLHGYISLASFEIRIGLELSVGLVLLVAAIMLGIHKDRQGIGLSYLGLLLSLTVINLLVFYFDQFSTIITALIQLLFLLTLIYYRHHFLMQVRK